MYKDKFSSYNIFLFFQLWNDKHHREQVVPALKESLQKLGLDYVDLYLIHFPIAVKVNFSKYSIMYKKRKKNVFITLYSINYCPKIKYITITFLR